jgi:CubicO group peptidase (beta-lactamase class C family)
MHFFKKKRFTKGLTILTLSLTMQLSLAYEFVEGSPESVGYDSEKLNELAEIADKLYEDGRIPNYILALYKDGKRFVTLTRGKTGLERGKDITGDTIFHLASMTKPVVTTAVFRLVQDKKISLDDKLSKYFPAFEQMMVAPDGDYNNQFEPAKREITLLDLVTHSSGFTYPENIAGFGDVGKAYSELGIFSTGTLGPGGGKTMIEHMQTLSEVPLVSHPGSEFNYSVSVDVLAAIIEQVTEMSLAQYLQTTIFEPLGMKSTGFTLNAEQVSRTSNVYGAEPFATSDDFKFIGKIGSSESAIDWKIAELIPAKYFMIEPSFYSGGGGLKASANDFARYLSMVAENGSVDGVTILEQRYADLHKTPLGNFDAEAFRFAFGDAAEYMTFGGGFGIKKQPENPSEIDYIFWAGAFNTFFWLDLMDNSIGVFYTSHWPVAFNISDALEEVVDGARL